METVMLHSSQNQTISPNKSHIRNSMKIKQHSFSSRQAENYFQPNFQAGILQTPHPFLYQSYPPYCLPQKPHAVFPQKSGSFSESRVLSFSPNNRKPNCKTNDQSQTPRKPKINSNSPKKGGTMMKTTKKVTHVSPDPKNLPKEDVPKMMTSSNISSKGLSLIHSSDKSFQTTIDNQVNKVYSSVIFTISPPPSSLPLPTFSLRPKLSCKTAAGIDTGATDDLRRLLHLP